MLSRHLKETLHVTELAFTFTCACVVAFLPFSLRSRGRQPENSMQRMLQGRWEIVDGVNQGRQLSEQQVDGTYVTITTNSIVTYDRDNQALYQAVFDLDEKKKAGSDHYANGSQKYPDQTAERCRFESPEMTALGIIKMESDSKWTLCYGFLRGPDRPIKFESPEGSR